MDRPPGMLIRELTKRFGDVVALDRLDLDVPAGGILGVLGPSGAGKSTLLRVLAGLARPTSGSASIGPTDGHAAAVRIGLLAQNPTFYGWMTGRELLTFVAELLGIARSEILEEVTDMLERVGLEAWADVRVAGYPADERQRLGIAQALLGRPDVALLDEPVASLDPDARGRTLAQIGELRGSTTVVLASREAAHVEEACDCVAVLDGGRLVVAARVDALVGGVTDAAYVVELDPGAGLAIAGLVARLGREPWVRAASVDGSVLTVAVRDEVRAAHELLPAVVATGVSIASFGRKRPSLQDAVAELVDRARSDEAIAP